MNGQDIAFLSYIDFVNIYNSSDSSLIFTLLVEARDRLLYAPKITLYLVDIYMIFRLDF